MLAGIIIASILAFLLLSGLIAYFKLSVPAMKNAPPISPEQMEICKRMIQNGKAYPFLCKKCVRMGKCPCGPCPEKK